MLLTLALLPSIALAGGDLLLLDARIVDAQGERHADAIVVHDGRITAIGARPDDITGAIDLHGATVVPGLIDGHVHLMSAPGGGIRHDPPSVWDDLAHQHLRAYLACGVTTVVDTGIPVEVAKRIEGWIAEGAPSPAIAWVGPLLSPVGGYPNVVIPALTAVSSRAEVAAAMDAFAPLHPVGVKLTFEAGFVGRPWPLYSQSLRTEIAAEASERGMPLYIHAISASEVEQAMALRPYAIVHTPDHHADRFATELAARGTFVMSTLSVVDALLTSSEPERLDAPPYLVAIPELERASALDRETIRASRRAVATGFVSGGRGLKERVVQGLIGGRAVIHSEMRAFNRSVRTLHEAGVPIVLGSDSGNWPVFLSEFHGPTTIRELELLVEAGLTPLEALTAATETPARMLGLQAEIGTIEVGHRADMVIVDGDPLANISAMRTPSLTVRNGVAHTPAEWMNAGTR